MTVAPLVISTQCFAKGHSKAVCSYLLVKAHWYFINTEFFADLELKTSQHAFVNVVTRGDLSSLRWMESDLKFYALPTDSRQELCSVQYAALNFRDIMLATGRLPPDAIPGDLAQQDCILGMEFSGTDSQGKRVMGLVPAKVGSFLCRIYKKYTFKIWTICCQF